MRTDRRVFAPMVVLAGIASVLVAPALVAATRASETHRQALSHQRLSDRSFTTYAMVQGLAGAATMPSFSAPGAREVIEPPCLGNASEGDMRLARCSLLPPPGTPSDPNTPGTPGTDTSGTTPPTPGTPPAPETPSANPGFAYYPPGDLLEKDKGRGRPATDRHVYVPNMLFPLKLGQGLFPHMNSQIWGYGGGGWGGKGAAGGSENDPRNYDPMRQRDNYCEVRGWAMPLCPSGAGHQGQDIRPPSYKDNYWEAVAVVDGVITSVTSNTTVQLKGSDGTDFYYLHMHPRSISVKVGQAVKQGQVLGRVSKYMGGSPSTSLHLHFNVRQRIKVGDQVMQVYVPTFTSLVVALRRAKGLDPGIDANGSLAYDAKLELAGSVPPPPAPAPKPAPVPPAPTPVPPAPEPVPPAPEPAPAPAPVPPAPAPAPAPAPVPPAPEPAPAPAPVPPAPEPAPAPAPVPPAPEPVPAPAPVPPAPAPAPAPEPAPAPQPAPEPAPQPEPQPAPAPPAEEQSWYQSWYQWGTGKVQGWWDYWWK